jgi:hypothetical protein
MAASSPSTPSRGTRCCGSACPSGRLRARRSGQLTRSGVSPRLSRRALRWPHATGRTWQQRRLLGHPAGDRAARLRCRQAIVCVCADKSGLHRYHTARQRRRATGSANRRDPDRRGLDIPPVIAVAGVLEEGPSRCAVAAQRGALLAALNTGDQVMQRLCTCADDKAGRCADTRRFRTVAGHPGVQNASGSAHSA